MNFLDGHLFPENQQPLVITAAPYGPEWIPSDFPEDIPVTMGGIKFTFKNARIYADRVIIQSIKPKKPGAGE